MNSKVKIVTNSDGNAITVFQDQNFFGNVRVQQYRNIFNNNGSVERKLLEAIIIGSLEDLKTLLSDSMDLPGKIIIMESLVPFDPLDPDSTAKVHFATKKHYKFKGSIIYTKNIYVENTNIGDQLIEHDNDKDLKNY